MNTRAILIGFSLLLVLAASSYAEQRRTINVAVERHSGEKMRGPVVITLTHVNVLKYSVLEGVSVTFSSGPDLRLPFIPPIPSAPAVTPPAALAGAQAAAPGLVPPDPLSALFARLKDVEIARYVVQGEIEAAVGKVSAATNAIQQLLASSDAALQADSSSAIVASIQASGPIVAAAIAAKWPEDDILKVLELLAGIRTDLNALPSVTTTDKARYDYLMARISVLEGLLQGVNDDSAPAKAFADAQTKLGSWQLILAGISTKARTSGSAEKVFELDPITIGCGFTFDQNKESKLELITRDRGADPSAPEQRTEIITVVCSSPLSISGGVAIAHLTEQEFGFVDSAKSTVDPTTKATTVTNVAKIGLLKNSGFRTVPVLLLNTRVWERSDLLSVGFSFGAGVDVKTGNVGSDIEYLLGPSVSFWRTLTVTYGWYIGRTVSLTGGYQLGDEVPTGLSAPPVTKSWDVSQVVAVTYKIR